MTAVTAPRPSGALPRIGTAGWSIPRDVAAAFPEAGVGLARYAARLSAVEINSTFYRRHRPSTFDRWAAGTPEDFRFAVKMPRQITHEGRLTPPGAALVDFLADIGRLGSKLGPVLVQLPPSLAFEPGVAETFFADLRDRHAGPVACEPRHASWFGASADQLLAALRIGRVGADPARHPTAGRPGGWPGLAYWRLHGSPRLYYSAYSRETLRHLADELRRASGEAWCIFDNTASGAAAENALSLAVLTGEHR